MTSTVVPSFSSPASFTRGLSGPRAMPGSDSLSAWLASPGPALHAAWAAYQWRAQARSLMQRADQFEATQPSYAADLRAAAMAVRQARVQAA